MRKLFKTLLILVVLVAVAGALYALARSNKGDKDGVKQVTIESGSITEKAIAVGQIQPRQKFSIKSKLSGIVKICLVNVGDRVRAGDALFEIAPDPTPQELTDVDRQLDSARASYERAQADFTRAQELVRQGLLPKSDMDVRREAFELARIALARAEQGRELTRRGRIAGAGISMESIVRAPAAGTVLTRAVNPGDPITPLTSYQPGTELATIADMSDLIFKGTVDEIDVGKLRVGLPTRIKVGALPTDVVTGSVSRIAPQAQQKEGATLFDVEIELQKDPSDRSARRILGQRRRHHPREEGRPDRARARRDVRGRRQESLRRDPGSRSQTGAEESRGQARHLRRHERGSRLGPEEGRQGGGTAAQEDFVK